MIVPITTDYVEQSPS